jgi:hypothetical protein
MQDLERYRPPAAEEPISIVHQDPDRGFLSIISISPAVAALAIATDLLLFGGDLISFGALLPFSAIACCVLGYCCYVLQRRSGDDHPLALAKGLTLALFTFAPVPITPIIAAPGAAAALLRNALKR